jgi:hypothetical protein
MKIEIQGQDAIKATEELLAIEPWTDGRALVPESWID